MRTLFFALLLSAAGLSAQDSTYAAIGDRLAQFSRANMARDFDAVLAMTDPELFEFIPQAVLAEQLRALEGDQISVVVTDFAVEEIGEVMTYGEEAFASVRCRQRMTFTVTDPALQTTEAGARLKRMLEKRFGVGSVRAGSEANSWEVKAQKTLFAVRRQLEGEWFFIEYRPENAGLLELLLPPVVRAELVGG